MGTFERYIVKVEEGVPGRDGVASKGPVYRSVFAEDGCPPPPDGVATTWDLFTRSVKRGPDNRMLGAREIKNGQAGKYVWQTYKQVYDNVLLIGSAMRHLGVEPKGRCGIYGINCPEWFTAMEACNGHSIVCVPLYDTLGLQAVEFIANHAEISIAFVQEIKLPLMLQSLANCTTFLRTLVSFGTFTREQRSQAEESGVAVYSWQEFLDLGARNPVDLNVPTKNDLSTIMYTSGTTGEPKGVMLSHENVLTTIAGLDHFLKALDEKILFDDSFFSYLPLAHIFDRVAEEMFVYAGGSIGFWQGDIKKVPEDIAELKPTFFVGVPRVFDRLTTDVKSFASSTDWYMTPQSLSYRVPASTSSASCPVDGSEEQELGSESNKGLLRREVSRAGCSILGLPMSSLPCDHSKLNWIKKGFKQGRASPLFDRLVFNKVKMGLGGHVRLVLSGGAPLSAHVEEFLRVIMCAPVVQGYGLTETCGASFIQIPDVISMNGTVGPPLPGVDARLESVPELNYDALDNQTPRGEICMRGNAIFSGYYKREDLTEDALTDGWFHTGDIGEWQPNGAMKIIDRKKNIFKLSQGEYLAVENLENLYNESSAIDAIWVYGNSFESTVVAVAIPNQQVLEDWAKTDGEEGDYATLCKSSKANQFILSMLTATGKKKGVKGFEFIKGVHLDPVPFDLERDLTTPTFKLKRPQLLRYYQKEIDALYRSMKSKQ